jgi:heme-degrading monooxygenase HmoA
MIVSILRRKSRLNDRARWEAQLAGVLPKIIAILEKAPGFVSVQYAWDVNGEGEFAQITTWQSEDACKRYVREGSAATIATLEEAAVPTALHPHGKWVRQTYEVVER